MPIAPAAVEVNAELHIGSQHGQHSRSVCQSVCLPARFSLSHTQSRHKKAWEYSSVIEHKALCSTSVLQTTADTESIRSDRMGQGIKEYFLVAAAPELGFEEQQVWA